MDTSIANQLSREVVPSPYHELPPAATGQQAYEIFSLNHCAKEENT